MSNPRGLTRARSNNQHNNLPQDLGEEAFSIMLLCVCTSCLCRVVFGCIM